MGPHDLADIGIGFSLFETPRLASLVGTVVAEEQASRPPGDAGRPWSGRPSSHRRATDEPESPSARGGAASA